MKLKQTFSTIPKQYEKARFDYPAPMYRDILKYAKLKPSSPILEIGVGTGKGTEPIAKTKNPLTAIDISPELIKVAKKKFKKYNNIKYIAKSFEKTPLPRNNFGLVYSAQSFHWIDPAIGFRKVYNILQDNGALAFFWNMNIYNKGLGRHARYLHRKYSRSKGGRANKLVARIKKSKDFKDAKEKDYYRTITLSKKHYIDMLTSYSWFIDISAEKKVKVLAELNKFLTKFSDPIKLPIRTKLILARKNDQKS